MAGPVWRGATRKRKFRLGERVIRAGSDTQYVVMGDCTVPHYKMRDLCRFWYFLRSGDEITLGREDQMRAESALAESCTTASPQVGSSCLSALETSEP